MNIAILVLLENYASPFSDGVVFAKKNGTKLLEALAPHGFSLEDSIVLADEQATKAAVESKIRRAMKSCLDDDIVFLYYAGHSFSWKSRNRLTVYDSNPVDVENTTISMQWLHQQFADSDCKKIVFLLDTGEKPLAGGSFPDPIGVWDEDELRSCFESSKNGVCFSSCKPEEVSHVSRKWQSGIWMYHVVEALDGRATAALSNNFLKADGLQSHLSQSVARTLLTTYSSKKRQSPTFFGAGSGANELLDFGSVLASRKDSGSPFAVLIGSVSLWSRKVSSVKSLAGFKKGHSIPDRASVSSHAFVAQLASEQVSEDLKQVFQSLKAAFKLKRADAQVSDEGDGTGTIITPYFNYSVSVHLVPEDPTMVVWSRSVDSIKDAKPLFSGAFASVFQKSFDTVEFDLATDLDVSAFIDAVETADDERIGIEYDPESSYCLLSIAGIEGKVRITSKMMTIEYPKSQSPQLLLSSFLAIRTAFLGPQGIDLVAIDQL